jgi:hypothetical protein
VRLLHEVFFIYRFVMSPVGGCRLLRRAESVQAVEGAARVLGESGAGFLSCT